MLFRSPCALGAILNDATIPQLKATVIAGAANNQLAVPDTHGAALSARGVLYAPDFCINAGGIIDIYYEGPAYHAPVVEAHLQRIGLKLTQIFERAEREPRPNHQVADRLPDTIFQPP